jgi:hypothetical protein
MRRRRRTAAVAAACVVAATSLLAIDLQPRTSQAYDRYAEQARKAFEGRAETRRTAAVPRDGVLSAQPGREDGIITVEGGLVHHWVGTAFVRGVELRRAVEVSSDYPAYSRIFRTVVASRLLAHEQDTYRVLMRLKEGEAGVTAILDVESTIRYWYPTPLTAYAISSAERIREVKNAGDRDERLLDPGRDSGYLWRANTFTFFSHQDDGVYIEMETLGLSRRFPPMLGWVIEPIARRVGRRSVETSLREFVVAVRARQP